MDEITLEEASALATHFYRLMDAHVPVDTYLSLIDEEHIIVGHGGTRLEGWSAFQRWYDGVLRACFDQVHTIDEVTLVESGMPATARIVARWQAVKWDPPAARTETIDAVATHHLVISRDEGTGEPVVNAYLMTNVQYAPGSAQL